MGIQVFFTYHQFRKKQYQNKSYQRRRENKITKNRKKLDNIKISQYCQKQINNIKYFILIYWISNKWHLKKNWFLKQNKDFLQMRKKSQK